MEQVHPIVAYRPQVKKEYVELAGGFVLELHELLAGNELARLDDHKRDRRQGRVLTQAQTRVNITADEVDFYTWVEYCCKAIYKVPEGGTWKIEDGEFVGGEKVLESSDIQEPCFSYLDVVRASVAQKDRLMEAGEKAWALTTGRNLEELKKGASPILTSVQEATENENSDSSVSTSESPSEPQNSEDSPLENSTTSPTPELQTVS